jgi:hypothetical protein
MRPLQSNTKLLWRILLSFLRAQFASYFVCLEMMKVRLCVVRQSGAYCNVGMMLAAMNIGPGNLRSKRLLPSLKTKLSTVSVLALLGGLAVAARDLPAQSATKKAPTKAVVRAAQSPGSLPDISL